MQTLPRVAGGCLGILLLIGVGCERPRSPSQQKLNEWLPASATNLFSESKIGRDETTLISFTCSPPDLLRLRDKFAREEEGVWKHLPLDRRTSDLLNLALKSFELSGEARPPLDSGALEYLSLPEAVPYLVVGQAVIIDSGQNRIWYIYATT